MVRNVNVNIDSYFILSCGIYGWLTILAFPVKILGDWLFPNINRSGFSTAQMVGEGESVSWLDAQPKG